MMMSVRAGQPQARASVQQLKRWGHRNSARKGLIDFRQALQQARDHPSRKGRLCTTTSTAADGPFPDASGSPEQPAAAPSHQQPAPPQEHVPWGLGTVAAVMLTAWVGGGAAAFWVATKLLGPLGEQLGGGTVRGILVWSFMFSLTHAALVLATLQLWVGRYRQRRDALFLLSWRPWRQWLPSLALGVAAIVIYFVWCATQGQFLAPSGMSRMLGSDWAAWALEVASVAVVVPLYKEALFRGFLQPSLCKYLPPSLAIVVSAAAFALAHFNPTALADYLAFGLLYGVAYAWTQSLWPPIILHGLMNLGTVILTALF